MYKFDLPLDTREANAIARRRNCEEQRKSRIFDARTRQIGVDTAGLSAQIEEKRLRDQIENERKNAYDAEMIKNSQICSLLDTRQKNDTMRQNVELNKFRADQQTAASRREFDLYDPESKKKDKPARVSDDDPRCQVSGLQLFQGEDLSAPERKKLQQEQMREWIKQQLNEKNREQEAARHAEALYQKKMMELDSRAVLLGKEEDECRRNLNIATKNYNAALDAERKAKEAIDKQKELDDNFTELSNQVFGDTLTENPAVAQSSFGAHRVITDRWKGMNEDQKAEIQRIREQQQAEKQRKTEEERELQMEYERSQLLQANAATLLQRETERKAAEVEKKIAEENMRLQKEQKDALTKLTKEVYTNPPTEAYFTQFNTGTR